MSMSGIFENLLSSAIWALLIVSGGVVMAFLKRKEWKWATPILFGIGTSAVLSILFISITGHPLLSSPPTTPDNAEDRIKQWAADLGYSQERFLFAPPDTAFAYLISSNGGALSHVMVLRSTKDRPNYIRFMGQINVSAPDQALLAKLSPTEAVAVWEQPELQLAQSHIGYQTFGPDANHFQEIGFYKELPASAVTEDSFVQSLNDIDDAAVEVRASIYMALKPYRELDTK